ncbi:MFS transporter [Nonomuraea sp. NPDC050691]|uniref:MFS transporter n=1 Tax=Nonomuraea sp. NPDC050691 TaxID=3155661 RepID=UPI0033F11C7E
MAGRLPGLAPRQRRGPVPNAIRGPRRWYGIGTLYIPYFLQDVVGHPDDLLTVVAVNGLSVVALSVVSGWLSDRLGRRRILVFAGSSVMAAALGAVRIWPVRSVL